MKVKIFLEGNETREEAKELLFKALSAQEENEIHNDTFADPVMEAAAIELKAQYSESLRTMINEIVDLLDVER